MGQKLGVSPDDISDPHGQGSDLLGFGFHDTDAKKTFIRVDQLDLHTLKNVRHEPVDGAKIVSHHLEARDPETWGALIGASWRGITLHGQAHCSDPRYQGKTTTVTVRIKQVAPRAADTSPEGRGLWVGYQIALDLGDGRTIDNACRDDGDVAFPVPGYWNDNGVYVNDQALFSFACTRRDVATCLVQGYSEDAPADKAQLFEACTRMMRADYCGNGGSYTHDGTFISIWDNRNVSQREAIKPLVFEAAWDKGGAVCINRPRWNTQDPDCKDGRKPSRCQDNGTAQKLFPNTPLVFDDSCTTHPCQVVKDEPFPAPPQDVQTSAPSLKAEGADRSTLKNNCGGSAGR